MALVDMCPLLKDALQQHYTVGAFNFFNFDMLHAILQAAEEEQSPVIIQLCMSTHDYMKNFSRLVSLVKQYCEDYSIPIALNHDHCPTLKDAKFAIDCGFPSVMFDGSHMSFEDNVKATKEIVAYAHRHGACVEAELGCVPGFEDMVFSENAVLTDPKLAKSFVEQTQCDALAISVGTAHGGIKTTEHIPIYFDRLEEIARAIPDQPLVLHGAASLSEELFTCINQWGGCVEQMRICSEEDISKCTQYHVCKANMDVDNFMVYTAAIRRYLIEEPQEYNPGALLACATTAFQREVQHKMRNVTLSSGHNWLQKRK